MVDVLVEFATALREDDLVIGTGDVLGFCAAGAAVNAADLLDLYWAGRVTLVTRRDQLPVYDRAFRAFFLGEDAGRRDEIRAALRASSELSATIDVPETEPGNSEREDQQARLGLVASGVDALRNKSFAACTTDELATLRRIMTEMRLAPPRRRTRRTVRGRPGRVPDLRRTMRETLRTHGEPRELYWRRRRYKLRPLVFVLDVSGSMADYSRNLLQFAYSARRAAPRVEVFCFGSRLTRITRELRHRRPDVAMNEAAAAVVDWDGGTRIGESLDAFVRGWARRGIARGGIVVICSDGLDRGDPAVLAAAMERLSRLCHRVVWMSPNAGTGRAAVADTLALRVAEPYVDHLLSARDLAGLATFAAVLPGLD
jgi:uncharacterized protein with von Willebrand factor type A (vWA) domain